MGSNTCKNLCKFQVPNIKEIIGNNSGYINYKKDMFCRECQYITPLSSVLRCPCCNKLYRRTSHSG